MQHGNRSVDGVQYYTVHLSAEGGAAVGGGSAGEKADALKNERVGSVAAQGARCLVDRRGDRCVCAVAATA